MNLWLPRGKAGGTGESESVGYGKPTRPHCRAQGTLLSVMGQPGGEGGLGEKGSVCKAESLRGSPETMATLFISSPPTENKVKKKDGCQSRLCM